MRSLFNIWLIALLSLTSLTTATMPAHALQMGAPITVEAYWELVGNTRQAITKMEALPEAQARDQLDGLASQWEKVTAVELPDQSILQVDTSHLVKAIRKDPPALNNLASLLDALLNAHQEYPQKVFTVQDLEPLKQILARPEFQWQQAQNSQAPNWLQAILDAFGKFMERLVYGVQNMVYHGRAILIVGAVILFVFSLYFVSRNLSRNLVHEAQLAAENGDGDELLTSTSAMQRAQSLSGQGDYRNAIRYLYLSSLLMLDERRLLRYDRSRTNREYLRSVSSKPELSTPLSDVIDVFDKVWYGFESVDEQTYQSYIKHVDELREQKES